MTAGTTEAEPQLGAKAHSHGAGVVPEQSRAERQASFDVTAFGVPTGREEIWRFTPMDRLGELHTGSFGQVVPGRYDVQPADGIGSKSSAGTMPGWAGPGSPRTGCRPRPGRASSRRSS